MATWTPDDIARYWPRVPFTLRRYVADACRHYGQHPNPLATPPMLTDVWWRGGEGFDPFQVCLVTTDGRRLVWPLTFPAPPDWRDPIA